MIDNGWPAEPRNGHPLNYVLMPALQGAYDNLWGNTTGPDGRGLSDAYADAWGVVAEQARDLPRLLGYDIINEPFPGSGWQACLPWLSCPDHDLRLYEAQRKSIERIREHDSRSMVFYEPWSLFNLGADTSMPDLEDERAGMSFHIYCGPLDCKDVVLANAHRRSLVTGDALLLSEFMDLSDSFLSMLAGSFVSWQYWAWRGYDCCHREYGIIGNLGEPPTPDNLDQGVLDKIVQPFARAIAGTPIEAAFDQDVRRYTLEYTPSSPAGDNAGILEPTTDLPMPFPPPRAGGRRAVRRGRCAGARRRTTEVFIPQRHYPLGYEVRIVNGTVLSREDEPLLLVKAASPREAVLVEVTPK